MKELREICNKYSKWKVLEDCISRIETYSDNGPLVADNCKCLFESICKTILEDLGVEKESHKQKFHELARQTAENLGCIKKVPELISAFTNVAQKIAELRNNYTETGHGQSVYSSEENRKKFTTATIVFMIGIIEQTVIYLITVYQDEYPQYIKKEQLYEDNQEFNDYFDEFNDPIEIDQYGPYRPCEILFYVDKKAYDSALAEFSEIVEDEGEE